MKKRGILIFLAVSLGLFGTVSAGNDGSDLSGWGERAWAREVPLEAARSYGQGAYPFPTSAGPTFIKLKLALEHYLGWEFDQAERLTQEVLWETRDPEEIAVVRQMLVQLDEARSLPTARKVLRPSSEFSVRSVEIIRRAFVAAPVPDPPSLEAAGRPLLSWLEKSLPVCLDLVGEQLHRYLEVVGEERMTRVFTEKEFQLHVLNRMQKRFPSEIQDLVTKFRPDGIAGSGTVRLGSLKFRVFSRMNILLEEGRPHAVIHEARIGSIPVPAGLLKLLERRVNRTIDRQDPPVRIKLLELREGTARVSVEIA